MDDVRRHWLILGRWPLPGWAAVLIAATGPAAVIMAADLMNAIPDWITWAYLTVTGVTVLAIANRQKLTAQAAWRKRGGTVIDGGEIAELRDAVAELTRRLDAQDKAWEAWRKTTGVGMMQRKLYAVEDGA